MIKIELTDREALVLRSLLGHHMYGVGHIQVTEKIWEKLKDAGVPYSSPLKIKNHIGVISNLHSLELEEFAIGDPWTPIMPMPETKPCTGKKVVVDGVEYILT